MKKLFVLFAAAMLTASASAQGTAVTSSKFGDNWYAGINVGIATYPKEKFGDDGFFTAHVTELGAAAENVHMAVCDGSTKITRYRLICIEATSIELLDISILYLPSNITGVIGTISFTYALHSSATDGAKAAAVDVALSVVVLIANVTTIKTCKVELVIIATRHRNW